MESQNFIELKNLEVYQLSRKLSSIAWEIFCRMDYFDKKHIIKLKETIAPEVISSMAATLGSKADAFAKTALATAKIFAPKEEPINAPKEEPINAPKNEFIKPQPANAQHMMSQKKTGMADFWKEANEEYPYNGSTNEAYPRDTRFSNGPIEGGIRQRLRVKRYPTEFMDSIPKDDSDETAFTAAADQAMNAGREKKSQAALIKAAFGEL